VVVFIEQQLPTTFMQAIMHILFKIKDTKVELYSNRNSLHISRCVQLTSHDTPKNPVHASGQNINLEETGVRWGLLTINTATAAFISGSLATFIILFK